MTFEDLVAAVRGLDGQPVSVSFHSTPDDLQPVLHVQGRLHRDDVDDTPDWVQFIVGEVPYPDEPMKRAKLDVFQHAYFDLQRAKIVSAAWRDTDDAGPFLAVVIRGGSMLRIWPHR